MLYTPGVKTHYPGTGTASHAIMWCNTDDYGTVSLLNRHTEQRVESSPVQFEGDRDVQALIYWNFL